MSHSVFVIAKFLVDVIRRPCHGQTTRYYTHRFRPFIAAGNWPLYRSLFRHDGSHKI